MILDIHAARISELVANDSEEAETLFFASLERQAQAAVQAERERIAAALRKRGDTEPTTAEIRGFWYRAANVVEAP